MIKVILFDADGVLIETELFSKQYSRKYNVPLEAITEFFMTAFDQAIEGKADLKEIITPYLKSWKWDKSTDEFLEYWFTSEHHLNEQLMEYIHQLRKNGIQCFVATNQERHRAKYMLEKMGFSKSFDKLYASSHLGAKKPDMLFFQKVFDDLNHENKNEILFWDDKAENIEVAKEFGIHAELYTSFEAFKEKMKSYLSLS